MVCIFTACDDTTGGLGYSITDTSDNLTVVADTFSVSSETVRLDKVISRSTMGYLGKIKDTETNSYITGNIMGQLCCVPEFFLPSKDSLILKDGEIAADSCILSLYYTTYTGDSTASMKCTFHEMAKPLSETEVYPTTFEPTVENGYLRENGLTKSVTYALTDFSINDTTRWSTSYRGFQIHLNDPYTDKDGKTYNNLGSYLMQKYYENKENFSNTYDFVHNIFPGYYIESTGGIGCMANVSLAQLLIYYKYTDGGSKYIESKKFLGTEEVLQKTYISQDDGRLDEMKNEGSHTYLKTPAGLYTQITLPVEEIFADHNEDTLNTARIFISRENNTTETTDYSLPIPSTVLILPADSVENFFANSNIADNRDSYLATYSSSTNGYTFGNLSGMVRAMNKAQKDSGMSSAAYAQAHPNWNKAVIVPVTTSYTTISSSSVLTRVAHDMSLQSTKLVGGKDNPGAIQVTCIYSKFKN